MPVVPTYDGFQVRQNTLPQPQLTPPQATDYGDRQLQQAGAAADRAGGQLAQIVAVQQQQDNQIRLDDQFNQLKESALELQHGPDGFLNLRGHDALYRPNGEHLANEYGQRLDERAQQIADGLKDNPALQQQFMRGANDIKLAFRGQALAHTAQESQTYGLSVAKGVQETAMRDIALNWQNPDAINSAVERIQAETHREASLRGYSAEWQQAEAQRLTSSAHKTALLTAIENDRPDYADAYIKRYSSQMTADDILTVRGHLKANEDAREAMAAAGNALGTVRGRFVTSDADRAFNIVLAAESGGRQADENGQPLTSPKGAVGIAQVMPDTGPEAARLAGLPWDENRLRTDAQYNRALGAAYFQQQVRTFGGDLAKAFAAYNAGPGAVRQAVEDDTTASKLPDYDGRGWLGHLPKETQDYVAQNMKAYAAGMGAAPRPTFLDIDQQLRADPRLAGDPARYKLAREEAERQFKDINAALTQRDEANTAAAMRALLANGGSWASLPASVQAAVPADKLAGVMQFAKRLATGDDKTDMALYAALADNPQRLTAMTDDQFTALQARLSAADFKHFADKRGALLSGTDAGKGPDALDDSAVKRGLDERLTLLGIDPTPKPDDLDGAARIGAIRQFTDRYLLAAQRSAGKKFTDADIARELDGLLANNVEYRSWFTAKSRPLLATTAGDIDSATRKGIEQAFAAQGNRNPTDAQVLSAYLTLQTTRR